MSARTRFGIAVARHAKGGVILAARRSLVRFARYVGLMPPRTPVFWFYGRFTPPPTTPFHVPEAFGIGDRFGVNLMGDAFWIALPNRDSTPFDDLFREVELLASAFVGAYAMKTEAEMTAYVEA